MPALLVVAALLAACSTAESAQVPHDATDPVAIARSFYPDDQVPSGLAEVGISFDVYDAAARDYRACLDAEGVEVGAFELDESGERYFIVTAENPETHPPTRACYEDFRIVDAAWQIALEQQRTRTGTDERRRRLEQCLDRWQLSWSARMHRGELAIRLLENGISDLTCEPLD